MAAPDTKRNVIDRQATTPFHLKLFYRQNSYHHLSDFPIPSPGNYTPPLPAHLEIYTWQSCTLRELSQLLSTALPSQLPDPAVGTRLCFRLIYPDTRGAAADGRGRYLSKEIGSVILGPSNRESRKEETNDTARENGAPTGPAGRRRVQEDDADKTLADARFVIGDYVDCAILPPLEDGSVAPPISGRGMVPSSALGGGMRAFGGGPPGGPIRENGYGGGRRGPGWGPGNTIPSGDWKRGERLPEGGGRGGYGRRGGRY
jgi:histone deacetylase complex subunit SAP18